VGCSQNNPSSPQYNDAESFAGFPTWNNPVTKK
jgi:hypothetical protein